MTHTPGATLRVKAEGLWVPACDDPGLAISGTMLLLSISTALCAFLCG
jgi:hypothetical protein